MRLSRAYDVAKEENRTEIQFSSLAKKNNKIGGNALSVLIFVVTSALTISAWLLIPLLEWMERRTRTLAIQSAEWEGRLVPPRRDACRISSTRAGSPGRL